ncbi:hypothetical protein Pmani_013806 [Petrolisthes manimaculis]|uniref:Ribosome biogenesis protein BRX1 homolog n=1 Tax=Petrolisthes manimaculis TaxID=1843537 RepID=A0AAE1PXL1_9EUCA|nr:hypothetical protein Pmani_013806 [Petrolisthes manimaculis]
MGKRKRLLQEKRSEEEEVPIELPALPPPRVRDSDEPVKKKGKWMNRKRVLVLSARGLTHRCRHLMNDMRSLLPHSKPEPSKERKDDLKVINEIAEVKNCDKCLYFESRKGQDYYLWLSSIQQGPSVKFQVLNVHTMKELKMSGNCLKGSRPLLSFDDSFSAPHWALIKELLIQTLGTPNHHPKSQPFHDHVFTFTLLDEKIWFRNFEILDMNGKLAEIGPRFVLDPVKIFEGSFGGATLWDNPNYISPNTHRQTIRKALGLKYVNKTYERQLAMKRRPDTLVGDPTNEIFQTKAPEDAKGQEKQLFIRKKNMK